MSFIEVIECSASDLIGQYVGHTGPKTRAQLDKALGKVLFIDEAYRLAEGRFATEAINELVDQLTKPKYMDKLIVVLAGYAQEINKLLSINPGLSSRFPEEISFKSISPMQCLEILERTIQEQKIQTPALTDPDSQINAKMVGLIKELSATPSWGNARDMKTLAKTLIGFVFATKATSPSPLAISEDDVFHQTRTMLKERQDRHANLPSTLPIRTTQEAAEHSHEPPHLPTLAESSSSQATPTPKTPKKSDEKPTKPHGKDLESDASASKPQPQTTAQRDAGVSDEIWAQLQADAAAAANAEPKITEQAFWDMQDLVSTTWESAHQADLALKRLELSNAKDDEADAAARQLSQKQAEARARQERAREEQEKAKAALETMRIRVMAQKRERAAQEKLRMLGVCVQGFRWVKQRGGYRCAGGTHFVGDERLGL